MVKPKAATYRPPARVEDMSMDIWDDDSGAAIDRRPGTKKVGDDWYIEPHMLPADSAAARRRAVERFTERPNKRSAVPVPLAGQSYNPTPEDHSSAVKAAVRKLEKRKEQHEKFVKKMALRAPADYRGDLNTDRLWDEEVKSSDTPLTSSDATEVVEKRLTKKERLEKAKRERKERGAKKKNAIEVRRDTRASRMHARHPDRKTIAKDMDRIDELMLEVDKQTKKSELRQIRRVVRKAEGKQLVKYGRHMATPMAPDVLPTGKVSGTLRHMKPSQVSHPALDRAKSLEERGLVPARMRHTYNKRKMGRAPGEVRVVSEEFGGMVE